MVRGGWEEKEAADRPCGVLFIAVVPKHCLTRIYRFWRVTEFYRPHFILLPSALLLSCLTGSVPPLCSTPRCILHSSPALHPHSILSSQISPSPTTLGLPPFGNFYSKEQLIFKKWASKVYSIADIKTFRLQFEAKLVVIHVYTIVNLQLE